MSSMFDAFTTSSDDFLFEVVSSWCNDNSGHRVHRDNAVVYALLVIADQLSTTNAILGQMAGDRQPQDDLSGT